MKKIKLLLLSTSIAINAFAQITNPAPYCTSQVNNGYNMISSVNVQGTNFLTGPEGSFATSGLGYSYYNTTTFPALTSGSNATVSIGFFSPDDLEPMYYAVWIDFNQNNTFEASELVMQNSNTNMSALPTFTNPVITLTKTFAVPAGLANGTTRMRVRRGQKEIGSIYAYDNTFTLAPCPTYAMFSNTYGYTYDFNVVIGTGGGGGGVMPPDAAFTANTTTATVNSTTVTFTDQSTNTPISWAWTFTPNTVVYQNGTSATSQNPQVKFSAVGTYSVKLKATNAGGSDSVSQVNYVNVQNPAPQPPDANFSANILTTTANSGVVTFTDQSLNAPTSRNWSFMPNTVTFQNGTSATSTNPQVSFNNAGMYSVKLLVSNANGSDSITKPNYITVVPPQGPPDADFVADIVNATANVTVVTLTDLSTANPTSRYWSITPNSFVYQNNTNATSTNPKLIFTAAGDYTVKLKVTNAEGTDSTTKLAYIHVSNNATAINPTNKDENLLSVFPNPTHDLLNFDIPKTSKIKTVTILNSEGKVAGVYNNLKVNQLNVSDLAKGMYFIQISFENGTISSFRKFSKL